MILKIPRYHFNRDKVETEVAMEMNLLRQSRTQTAGVSTVEIVPYENLWELALEALD